MKGQRLFMGGLLLGKEPPACSKGGRVSSMEHMHRVKIKTKVLEGERKEGDTVILTYKIAYPFFTADRYELCLMKLNRYYEEQAKEYLQLVDTEYYPAAKEQYAFDKEHGYPTMVYEAMQTYTETYNRGCIVSLYWERYAFTGGAHGNTVRGSETWNLQGCGRLALTDLFGCGIDPKTYILREAGRQIEKEPGIYFPDYEKLLAENFREESFYTTPDGLVFYYQQYDIAPYSSGIRTFLIPYGKCVRDPIRTCFRI